MLGTDPDKRPTFKAIIESLERDELSFPGTNHNQVMIYKKLAEAEEQIATPFDVDNVSENDFNSILNGLQNSTSLSSSLAKIDQILNRKNWLPLIEKSQLMDIMIDQLMICADPPLANQLVYIF